MVFDMKQDLWCKVHMVTRKHVLNVSNYNCYASTIKSLSVCILDVILHLEQLESLCGDIGNMFVNTYTNEKIYVKAGKEFDPELEGKTVIIIKALYGLRTSTE